MLRAIGPEAWVMNCHEHPLSLTVFFAQRGLAFGLCVVRGELPRLPRQALNNHRWAGEEQGERQNECMGLELATPAAQRNIVNLSGVGSRDYSVGEGLRSGVGRAVEPQTYILFVIDRTYLLLIDQMLELTILFVGLSSL